MHKAANHRDLRAAVERLARTNVSEADVSRAIDCFGQVLADLTETPLRLAVITGEAFEENNELRAEVQRLKILLNVAYGDVGKKHHMVFAGFNIVEDSSMAVCVNHDWETLAIYSTGVFQTCRMCKLERCQ